METLLFGARVALAGVFATASIAKLADIDGSRRSLAAFGVPRKAVATAALLLPVAELVTAAALMPASTARWAAVAALVLLLAFAGAIALALSRGRAPDCHCFGQLHSAPAGAGALLRNVALAGLAAIVAWRGPGPSIGSWAAERTGGELAALAAGAVGLAAVVTAARLWRSNRSLREDLEAAQQELAALPSGLPRGAPAPSFTLPDTRGAPRTLESLIAGGRPVVLVFVAPDCGSCGQLLSELGRWQAALAHRLTLAVISRGDAEANRTASEAVGEVLLQEGSELMNAYRVRVTPTAVAISAAGRIASAPAEGAIAVEPLIRLAVRGAGAARPAAELSAGHPT